MENRNFIMSYTVDKTFDSERFIKLRLRVCHDQLSPNSTYMTKEVMKNAESTLEYIPILAHVILDEDGKPVFGSHDMHIEEDKLNDGQGKLIYDEQPIGLVPKLTDANVTIEEYEGLNYVYCDAYIWKDYSNYAEQLITDAVDTKLSMEIAFPDDDSFAFNVTENRLDIFKYCYRGITLLNENLGTGMKNAMATTENFSLDDIKSKMIVLMQELQKCLFDFNKSTEKEDERMTKFDELLAKYEKTKENITFEVEGLSDEELETKFDEVFGCKKKKKCSKEHFDELLAQYNTTAEDCGIAYEDADEEDVDAAFKAKFEEADPEPETPSDDGAGTGEGAGTDDDDDDDTSDPVPVDDTPSKKKPEKYTRTFELSHDDIRSGIYGLYDATGNYYMWIEEVYDTYFIAQDCRDAKHYKQGYTKTDDSVAFDGDPVQVYYEWLTQAEKESLANLKADYAVLKDFKAKYDAAELKAAKDAIFADANYECLSDEDAFKVLKADAEKFSVEEIRTKCDLIFAAHIKAVGTFVKTGDEPQAKSHKVGFNFVTEPDEEYAPYGNILPAKKKTK